MSACAVFPACIGIGDHMSVAARERRALVAAVEQLLDVLNVIADALGLAEQLLGTLHLLLKLLERAER